MIVAPRRPLRDTRRAGACLPRACRGVPPPRALKRLLDRLYRRYGAFYLPTDPLELVHAYRDPRDVEMAAVVAAGLAFGNAVAIRSSVRAVLDALGPHPARAVRGDPVVIRRKLLRTGHRWIRGPEIAAALAAVASAQQRHGDLESAFLAEDDVAPDLARAMDRLVDRYAALRPFFAAPSSGSACKRFCLLLRWLARGPDGVDLGIWRHVLPARLTIPLDVHVGRIARALRLTSRKSDDWKAAREVTEALAACHPVDPLRYDFALCRLGMLGEAQVIADLA